MPCQENLRIKLSQIAKYAYSQYYASTFYFLEVLYSFSENLFLWNVRSKIKYDADQGLFVFWLTGNEKYKCALSNKSLRVFLLTNFL